MTAAGGASLRNAGQIVPSLCIPLAAPGIMKRALGYMLKPTGPLRFRTSVDNDVVPEIIGAIRGRYDLTEDDTP